MGDRVVETGTQTVLAEVRGRVGIVTLNRPDRRNALHRDMYPAIRDVLAQFAGAADVGCVALTGAGTGFCAGGDVRDGRPRRPDGSRFSDDERVAMLTRDAQTSLLLHEHPKPTIAAVNGPAVGAGLSLALACDLRVAARSATLQTGWARLAFSGDFGGAWLLRRLVGPSRALELLLSNEPVGADAALVIGLVNRVLDDDELADGWMTWARRLAAGSADATAAMKANVLDAGRSSLADALPVESARMVACSHTADHKEAVRAWLDRRAAAFGGDAGE